MTSVDVLPEGQEDSDTTVFAPRPIQVELCDKNTPPSTPFAFLMPHKVSVTPVDTPDVEHARAPRYLRDPTRRNSVQPRKASVQIDNGSVVIENALHESTLSKDSEEININTSVTPIDSPDVENTRIPRYLRDPSRRNSVQPRKTSVQVDNGSIVIKNAKSNDLEEINIASTDHNIISRTSKYNSAPEQPEETKRKVSFKHNASLKSDANLRRNSVPVPPSKIDELKFHERKRPRRASHAGYRGNPARLCPTYGTRSNSLNKTPYNRDNEQELEIIINSSNSLRDDINPSSDANSMIKFELVSEEPSTSRALSDGITVFARIPTEAESHLPGMTSSPVRVQPGSGEGVKRTRRSTRRSVSGPFIPKPDNHIVLSVFSCLCCCPLVGIVAVILSCQVDPKYEHGEKEESIGKSQKARCWALSAVMLGMLGITGALMYVIVVFIIFKK